MLETIQRSFAELDYLPLLLAVVLGGAIGLERECHGRPAGLRTHILVCLSATMVILVAHSAASTSLDLEQTTRVFDPNRIGAGIVTGIGFLGAATVLRSGDVLRGLTTAACIWYVAVLGIVLGSGHYALGVVCTLAVLFVLTGIANAAAFITPLVYRRLNVTANPPEIDPLVNSIKTRIKAGGMRLLDVGATRDNRTQETRLRFHIAVSNRFQAPAFTHELAQLEHVLAASWETIE